MDTILQNAMIAGREGEGLLNIGIENGRIAVIAPEAAKATGTSGGLVDAPGEVVDLHKAVYSKVCNARFALYRDFPDACRDEPQE